MHYKITQSFFHKGWVYLLSVVENQVAFWSLHKTEDDENKGGRHYAAKFQEEHNKQIAEMHAAWVKEQEDLSIAEGITIDNRIEESRKVINQLQSN